MLIIRTCAVLLPFLTAFPDTRPPSPAPSYRVELEAPPQELSGITIEVHHTVAPQVVVSNPTAAPLEIFDARGRPFLRIGSGGVDGDRNASFFRWSQTAQSSATLTGRFREEGPPVWQRVSAQTSWSWFDPRLVSEAPLRAGERRPWYIPVAMAGRPLLLKGVIHGGEEPVRDAAAKLTSSTKPAPGVRVVLLPGEAPALLVENDSPRPVTVYGGHGEPFLRIGPSGVEANAESPTWLESKSDSAERAPAPTAEAPGLRWRKVSDEPRYAWLDPRARAPRRGRPAGATIDWAVPITVGNQHIEIRGRTLVLR